MRAKNIIRAMVVAALCPLCAELHAGQEKPLTALPMQGVSFDIGSKHVVSYFLSRDGQCDLAVMLSDVLVEEDEVAPGTPARFRIAIPPGKTVRVGSSEGAVAEFVCGARAEVMAIRTLIEVASNKRRK